MGVSTTAAQMTAKLDRLARDLRDVRVPLEATALRGKQIFEASAASAGVLGSRIPAKGKGRAIRARYDLNKTAGQSSGSAVISYEGPAHLVNNPTRPHVIGARSFGLRRRSNTRRARERDVTLAFGGSATGLLGAHRGKGARALTIGPDFRAYARHPGTRGKGFFQRARKTCETVLPQVYGKAQLTEPLRRTFG